MRFGGGAPAVFRSASKWLAIFCLPLVVFSIHLGEFDDQVFAKMTSNQRSRLALPLELAGVQQESVLVEDSMDCTLECLSQSWCLSINLKIKPEENGMRVCELLSTDRFYYSEYFTTDKEFTHFNIKNPCENTPCSSQAKCHALYNTDDYYCACARGYTGKHCHEVSDWPVGTYGLPKPVSGCPVSDRFEWQTGDRFQDSEDVNVTNGNSGSFHLDSVVGADISRMFCVKADLDHDEIKGAWPKGTYCIYRKGNACPLGFASGWVKWDDENSSNINKMNGTLPDGVYNQDTLIYFCCRSDGEISESISLPIEKPFYLLPYGTSQCQQVKFAVATAEWLRFDTEHTNNQNSQLVAYPYGAGINGHTIHYCYYTRSKPSK